MQAHQIPGIGLFMYLPIAMEKSRLVFSFLFEDDR